MSDNVVTIETIEKMLSLPYRKEALYLIVNKTAYNIYKPEDMAALEKYRQNMVLTLYREGQKDKNEQVRQETNDRT